MRNSKKITKGRGRPRAYDPDKALRAALLVFAEKGYGATSLDLLSEATGMNRPSLYSAFGDKKAIYRKALIASQVGMRDLFKNKLFGGGTLEEDLLNFFRSLIELYQNADGAGALGCPTICTATAEACREPEIQADLSTAMSKLEGAYRKRFDIAVKQEGHTKSESIPKSQLAAAIQHSLAIRTRAGISDEDAEQFITDAVQLLLK